MKLALLLNLAISMMIGSTGKAQSFWSRCLKLASPFSRLAKDNSTLSVQEVLKSAQANDLSQAEKRKIRSKASPQLKKILQEHRIILTQLPLTDQLHPSSLGEGLQAKFLRSFLLAVAPRAVILTEAQFYQSPQGSDLFLSLHDPWQKSPGAVDLISALPPWPDLLGHAALPMPLIKMANSIGSSMISKEQLREKLGLRSTVKIAHIYTYRLSVMQTEFELILQELRKSKEYDLVIVSGSRELTAHHLLSSNPRVVSFMSDLTTGDLQGLSPGAVIFNDTTGLMNPIHRLSDLTIVLGPINFFESINLSTPTIVVASDNSLKRFSGNGYRLLRDIAENSGRAFFIDSIEDFAHVTLDQTTLYGAGEPTYDQIVYRGLTPTELLLKGIEERLRYP